MSIERVKLFIRLLYGINFTARMPTENRLGSYSFDYCYFDTHGFHKWHTILTASSALKLIRKLLPVHRDKNASYFSNALLSNLRTRMDKGYDTCHYRVDYQDLLRCMGEKTGKRYKWVRGRIQEFE